MAIPSFTAEAALPRASDDGYGGAIRKDQVAASLVRPQDRHSYTYWTCLQYWCIPVDPWTGAVECGWYWAC